MKRFISALSSLCLAATTVVTAFPLVASAAGSASWSIAEKTVDAGFEVQVPVTVTGDEGTAGFVVNFEYDEALTFNGFTWGDAYTGEAVLNENELYVVWADDNGDDQTAADGATIVTLNFTAPDAAGRYPVEFATMDVVDTNEERLTITEQDGAVIVRESIAPGSSGWDIGEEYVEGGAEVAVPVTVIGDEGTAGFIANFAYNEALTFTGITWGDAYTGEAVINEDELRVVWADDNGDDQTAADEAVVLYLNFVAPDAAGEYPVTFTELVAVNTDGGELTLEKADGAVIVEDIPNIPEPGAADWDIAEETVAAGAEVALPVYILSDGGSAGFVVNFEYDEALTFNGISWGDAYTGEAVVNEDELRVVWADDNGENQNAAADSIVLYLNFTAPTTAGEYPVNFTELTVVDTYGQPLELTQEDGAVIVAETTTETTTTETTTTESTTTETTTTESTTTETTTTESTTTETTTTESTTTETTTTESTTTETTTTESTTTETTTTESTTTESTTTESTTTESTTTESTTTESTTTESTTTESTTTESTTTESTTTESTTTETTTTESTTTETTTTESTTTETTTTESTTTETTTTETTTTETTTETTETTIPGAPVNPGHVVYQIDDVNGLAGTTVKVPVLVWYDEGTAGITMQFAVEDGFSISGIEFGDAYTGADQVVWNPDEYIFVWDDPNGENQYAQSGDAILYLLVDVPADAVENTIYPVNFVNVTVSDTNSVAPEFTTVDGSITILEIPQDDPGNVVYNLEDVLASPGSNIDIPLSVWFDDGTSQFTMTVVVPDGFTIDDFTFGPEYSENGTFTFDPTTGVLTWTSNDGTNFVPQPGTTIGTLHLTVGDVEPGDYTVTLTDVVPTNEDGNTLEYTVNDSTVTISEKDLTIVNTYKVEFEEPTRVYYWSHDTRTFQQSGGLDGMSAYLYLYQYYVADGYFVDAEGNQILDANGNAMPYSETDTVYPDAAYAFNTVALDVTSSTKPAEDADSPVEVYVKGQHIYPIALYCDQTGNEIIIGDGSPLFMGEIQIFIGLKGDINLDEAVDTLDAIEALTFYNKVSVMGESYSFHEDEFLHNLAFYLGDVYYTQTPEGMDTVTASAILEYYNEKYVMGLDITWADVCGFDFPDSFFEG